MTVRAHCDAILAILRAAPGSLTVHDGAVPAGASPPYVVVYFADSDTDIAAEGASQRLVVRAYVHCVGANAAAARAVAERIRTALLDVTPTVPGRVCWPIRREDGQPPQRDESTGVLVMDRVDVYRLESVPA